MLDAFLNHMTGEKQREMEKFTTSLLIILIAYLVMSPCSFGLPDSDNTENKSDNSPIEQPKSEGSLSNRSLLGIWSVEFNISANSVKVSRTSGLDSTYNTKGLFQDPEIKITSYNSTTEIIELDLTITNPFKFNIYDARLIVFADDTGHTLIQQDNWTDLHDPAGGDFLNPIVRFYGRGFLKDRVLKSLQHEKKYLSLHLLENNPKVTFAIDASLHVNCAEPYIISSFQQDTLKNKIGASAKLEVQVYDHQTNVDTVYLHCPQITGQELVQFAEVESPQEISYFTKQLTVQFWEMQLVNNTGAPTGSYTGYIKATSADSGSMALYEKIEIFVNDYEPSHEWARTWGSLMGYDIAYSTACDNDGNIFVTGGFSNLLDFDPDPDNVVKRTSSSGTDVFVTKYDSNGNLEWVITWDSIRKTQNDSGRGIATDSLGNIYVIGIFYGIMDFDPGPAVDEHNSQNGHFFICKYDTHGKYIWGRNMFSSPNRYPAFNTSSSNALPISIDNQDNILITGELRNPTDFNPVHKIVKKPGLRFAFLSKFNSDGNLTWCLGWQGTGMVYGKSVCHDSFDNIFVTGYFQKTADFDPGPGLDEHTSNGAVDAYLSKFDSSGNFKWSRTWGGEGRVLGIAADTDNKNNVFVGGAFNQCAVDLDPGPGVDKHSSYSSDRVYLSRFDTKGNFIWGKSWGGNPQNRGNVYCMDLLVNSNDIYYLGIFDHTCDFDPGEKVDERTSAGNKDVFINKFNLDGDLTWVINFGGLDVDKSFGMALCNQSYLSIVGYYKLVVDFDPGSGVDEQRSNGAEDCYLVKLPTDFD